MLHFLIGRARSGKSYQVTKRIKECVSSGGEVVLLVPEQASFESEKTLLACLGDSSTEKVSILSFSRLCDEIERSRGGSCAKMMSETDKLALMSRAIKKAKAIDQKNGAKQSVGYVKLLVDAIGEFKINAVSYDDLICAAQKTENSLLGQKLKSVAEVYLEYDSLISSNFIDPSDRLTRLYDTLENFKYFSGKTVFIDGFKGFTGQQFKILQRILAQSPDVFVTLTCDTLQNENYGVFGNVYKTKRKIESIAESQSVKKAPDIFVGQSRFESEQLRQTEMLLSAREYAPCEEKQDIVVCKAETAFDEAQFAARSIRQLVRSGKARYRDIVVIARNPEDYSLALKAACEKNSVNCFADSEIPLSATPAGASVLAAMELLGSLTTEKILRFFKVSCALFTLEELSQLENYAYLWGIDGKIWEEEWDMNPNGFVSQEKEEDREALEKINELRRRAMAPIMKLRRAERSEASSLSRAIVEFLKECDTKSAFLNLCRYYDSQGKTALSNATMRAHDDLMDILNSLSVCFKDTVIDLKEYCQTLKSCILAQSVACVPQTIDEVQFGAADTIRPNNPKYVFILGANQGVFPAVSQSGGIFGNLERKKIIELGIDIPDKTLDFSIDEEFLVYSSVCCASRGVYISYNTSGEGECSAFVNSICENIGCKLLTQPDKLSEDNLPETKDALFAALCSRLPYNSSDTKTLTLAAENIGELGARLEDARKILSRPKFNISAETAKKLYGKRVNMSPSRFEDFNRCAFMYFCKHTLKIRRIEPAEFSAMQRGTMAHYVLQRLVETFGKGLGDLEKAEIDVAVENFAQEYLNSISGYRSIENARMKFIVHTVTRSLKEVGARLSAEFKQSDFEPVKCELRFGFDGDLPEISVDISPDGQLKLNGVVDRVDCFNGYVRVVDYKTGQRDFKLPDLLIGQNMQMLLYLYALCKDGRYGNMPAGVLYMPAFRQRGAAASKIRMNGVINSSEDIISAMEKGNEGRFVPKVSKTGSNDSFLNSADFESIFSFIDKKLKISGKKLYDGFIEANPVDGLDSAACKYCDFASICRIENEKKECAKKLSRAEVLQEIERQVAENGD